VLKKIVELEQSPQLNVVADLVVEEDAPNQVVLGFESRGIRIHRAKTLSAKSNGNPTPTRVRDSEVSVREST
jgi:hypothetical protein